MNSDGKIYIIVTDKLPDGSSGQIVNNTKKSEESDDELFAHWARDKIINTTKNIINSSVNYGITNIGNFTGDYITQTKINNAMHNLNALKSIGLGAVAGFKVGGIYGAVIGASLSVINSSVSSIEMIHSNRVQNKKTNYEIEQLRNRAGLNTLLDWSRGTEN